MSTPYEDPNVFNGSALQMELEEIVPLSEHSFPAVTKSDPSVDMGFVDDVDDMREEFRPASIPKTVLALVLRIVPAGSALSAGVNLVSTSLGAGIVGTPSGFASTGILMGIFYLVCVSAETAYSMGLVAQASELTGCQTYEELARRLLHQKANYFVACIRILNTFGGTVVFVVLIRDITSPILQGIESVPDFFKGAVGLRVLQAILFLVFMLPLTIPRYIDAMRYVSAVGIVFIIYLSVIIIVHSIANGFDGKDNTQLAVSGNVALEGLGIFIFAFMCQINCLEIYYEMTNRSIRRFQWSCWLSMMVCGSVYICAGLFGYLDFGRDVAGSILLEYDPLKNAAVFVCYVGVFVKICASFSLLSFACRSALFPLLGWDPKRVAFHKHIFGTLILGFINLALGIFVPNVSLAFSFVGGFCGGIIGFVLPALFIMYAGNWNIKSVGILNWVFTYLVLFAGVVSIVFGTASSIYKAAR